MSNKKERLIITITVIVFMLFVLGVTYAWFNVDISGTGSTMEVSTATLSLRYTDGNAISKTNWYPGDSVSKTFTVENTGSDTAYYDININITENTFVNSELVYTLNSTNNGAVVSEMVVPVTTGYISTGVSIAVGTTQTYTFTLTFKEASTNQNANQDATFAGTIEVTSPYAITADVLTFQGTLYDTNGSTMNNVLVTLHSDPQSTTTDSNGYFEFSNVEAGQHTLTVEDTDEVVRIRSTIKILPALETQEIKGNTFAVKGSTFSIQEGSTLGVEESSLTLYNQILTDNIELSDSNIDFKAINSDVNGKGLFYTSNLTKTEDLNSDGTGEKVYYYRGEVNNNYVLFDEKCFRIIRTNEDGSIRMMYMSLQASNTTCPTSYTAPVISKKYNTSMRNASYINYDGSNIKSFIDSWYLNNISTNAKSQVVTATYCSDMSYTGTASLYYGAYERLHTNKNPQYKCGNNALSLIVGLITGDELAYAGAVDGKVNSTCYLNANAYYWTMTPYYWNESYARVLVYEPTGNINTCDTCSFSGFPVISLDSNVVINENSNGTANNPYIIQ